MSSTKHRKPRLDLEIQPLRDQGYDVHQVRVRTGPHSRACGGYLVRRDTAGRASTGSGAWWVGVVWDDGPEIGPYHTLASARKAVLTDQVLTHVIHGRGWRSGG